MMRSGGTRAGSSVCKLLTRSIAPMSHGRADRSSMYEVKLYNLRVFAVRVGVVESVAEVEALWAEMRTCLGQTKGLVVATADWRIGALYRQEVSDALLGILKNDSPKLERSAHIVGPSALLGMQVERMVREARLPTRKVFRVLDEAVAYLGEVLTPDETKWLRNWYGTLPGTARG
jgi:hypothetical protein